jgi:hypothetical protein
MLHANSDFNIITTIREEYEQNVIGKKAKLCQYLPMKLLSKQRDATFCVPFIRKGNMTAEKGS